MTAGGSDFISSTSEPREEPARNPEDLGWVAGWGGARGGVLPATVART